MGEWRKLREEFEEYLSENATKSVNSLGRQQLEKQDLVRTVFERDTNRILHSEEFRRLRHKTQVFFNAKNDHICTRMEHVLYVSSISGTIARTLKLNQDLTNAISLGHDLGHPPFGHTGEKVLDECVKQVNENAFFQHERHSLRVVDFLATRLDSNNQNKLGLNLSYEVRDGIVSHCGEKSKEYFLKCDTSKSPEDIYKNNHRDMYPFTLEACVVRLVDKIAYVGRDIEDAVRAGLINEDDIPKSLRDTLGNTNGQIINSLVIDVIENSHGQNYIKLSDEKGKALQEMIELNNKLIYKNDKILRYENNTKNMIEGIFFCLYDALDDPEKIASSKINSLLRFSDFINSKKYDKGTRKEQKVVDYIAGMTDNYATDCFEELYWF